MTIFLNHDFRKPETDFQPVNSLTGYQSNLAFGSVTSFFGIKGVFFSKTTRGSAPNISQGLGENTFSLQPALKSNAPGL